MRATNGAAPWRLSLSVERDGHRAVIWHAVNPTGDASRRNAVMVTTGTARGWTSPVELDRPATFNGEPAP